MTKIEYGYISLDDFNAILSTIPERHAMYAIAFAFLRYRGLRPCEIVKIKLQDFDDDLNPYIHITKTNTHTRVQTPTILKEKLREYITNNAHRFINGYLFVAPNSKSNHITPNTLNKAFRHYFKQAKLSCDFTIDTNKKITNVGRKLHAIRLYDLKASFGTDIQRTTQDIYRTQIIMRHKDPRSTHAYMRRAILVKERATIEHALKK